MVKVWTIPFIFFLGGDHDYKHIFDQVKLGFTVKATSSTVGSSTADLAKKNKGSVASITKVVSIMMVILMNYPSQIWSVMMMRMVTPMGITMNYQLID